MSNIRKFPFTEKKFVKDLSFTLTKKVSIIMPIYNRYDYLQEALESVRQQTFKDFEILVVDDYSDPENAEIIKQIVNSFDERFKYIRLEENKGPGGARNVGFRMAKGEYIAILDSDDKYYPKKLEIGVDFLNKNQDFDMCVHFFKFSTRFDNFMIEKPFKNMKDNKVTFLSFTPRFYHWCMMIRKNSLEKYNLYYDEDRLHDIGEDSKFLYECIKKLNIKYIDKILYYYRKHSKNISFNNPDAHKNNKFKNSSLARYQLILDDFKIDYSEDDLECHWKICRNEIPENIDFLNEIDKWFFKITEHNKKIGFFPQKTLELVLADYYFEFCSKSARKYGFLSLKKFLLSSWLFKTNKNLFRRIVFAGKVILGSFDNFRNILVNRE